MVQLWVLLGLIVSAVFVSALGAAFSIIGVGKLFTGAVVAVWLMAGSLELAKFVIAAFLHQVWGRLNVFFRYYLLGSVVVLSLITSMGIFGFLSNAYQETTLVLDAENIKLEGLKAEQERLEKEMSRINKGVDEIPDTRITRKMRARSEAEPMLRQLRTQQERILGELTEANLKVNSVKGKVGPLLYIAKAFGAGIDDVVKWLILMFVSVFDPLAICLVIAVSESLRVRGMFQRQEADFAAVKPAPAATPQPPSVEPAITPVRTAAPAVVAQESAAEVPAQIEPVPVLPVGQNSELSSEGASEGDQVIQMRFAKDDQEAS